MKWLQRANSWLAGQKDEDREERPEPSPAAPDPPPPLPPPPLPPPPLPPTAGEPDDFLPHLRTIFARDSGGPGRSSPVITAPDPAVARIADQVIFHFESHRPEPASFPAIATQVIDLAEQLDCDLSSLVKLIEHDAAICSRVLTVANSAMYRRGSEIPTVHDAITHMGMFAVANIAVGVACRALYDADARAEFDLYPGHWREQFLQSMTVGIVASHVAAARRLGRPDQVFLAGLFHDIGKALSLRSLCGLVLAGRIPRCEDSLVDRVLDRTHVLVGVMAHSVWHLPQLSGEVCAHHHDDGLPEPPRMMEVHLVRTLSALNAVRLGLKLDERLTRQLEESVAALDLGPPDLDQLLAELATVRDNTIEAFGLPR